MKNLAITMLSTKYPELEYAWELHDGVYLWVDKTKQGLDAALDARQALNNLDYTEAWGWKPRIELPWDISVGTNWGSMREL